MVKLASTLPREYDDNGLEPNSRHLLARYTSQEYTPVIGIVHTKDVHHTEDFERIPRVEFVSIEAAFDESDATEVRALLRRLHDDRVKHVKQPLDLPDTDDQADEESGPLALEAGAEDDVVDAEVVDEDTNTDEEN